MSYEITQHCNVVKQALSCKQCSSGYRTYRDFQVPEAAQACCGLHWLLRIQPPACMHAFIHSFIHSSMQSYTHSFMHTFIHAASHSITHWFAHCFIHSSIRSFIESFIQPFGYLLSPSSTPLYTYHNSLLTVRYRTEWRPVLFQHATAHAEPAFQSDPLTMRRQALRDL